MGVATFLPLGFLSGWVASFILKKLNLLRVPVEVELEGLDMAEYETDFYPEHARAPEEIVEPDGTLIPAERAAAARAGGADQRPPTRRQRGRGGGLDAHLPDQPGDHVHARRTRA